MAKRGQRALPKRVPPSEPARTSARRSWTPDVPKVSTRFASFNAGPQIFFHLCATVTPLRMATR